MKIVPKQIEGRVVKDGQKRCKYGYKCKFGYKCKYFHPEHKKKSKTFYTWYLTKPLYAFDILSGDKSEVKGGKYYTHDGVIFRCLGGEISLKKLYDIKPGIAMVFTQRFKTFELVSKLLDFIPIDILYIIIDEYLDYLKYYGTIYFRCLCG